MVRNPEEIDGLGCDTRPITARDHALLRATERASGLDNKSLAAHLSEYADDIERDTGRAYVPTFMREAARRLAKVNA